MESIEKDFKLFESFFKMPPAWDCLQHFLTGAPSTDGTYAPCSYGSKVASDLSINKSKKHFSYSQYMRQLSEFEFDLLHSLYSQDFRVFGYEPCDFLSF